MTAQPTILITGANGFVGQHLVQRALNRGMRVYAVVRRPMSLQPKPGMVILKGDVTEFGSLLSLFLELKDNGVRLDYLVHAAALTKANSARALNDTNYNGTYNLLTALEQSGLHLQKLVFISSLAAAGAAPLHGMVDLHAKKPLTLYGKSKLKAEEFITRTAHVPYIIIRPTAVYGPGERELFSVFKLINKNLNPVMGSHEQEFTFIYVKDLVELILAAASSKETNKTYFATDGKLYDKWALASSIAKALHKKPVNIHLPAPLVRTVAFVAQYSAALFGKTSMLSLEKCRELMAESWNCDGKRIAGDLGYTPQYDLERGITETTQWYKEHHWL